MKTMQPKKTCHSLLSYCFTWEDYQKLAGLCASSRSHSAYCSVLLSVSWCLETTTKHSPLFLIELLLIFIRYSQTKGCSSNTIKLWWRWQWHGCWYWQWNVCSPGSKEGECSFSKKWFIKKVIQKWKFNLGYKIRKMYNGYYLVSVGQEIWYQRMLQDLNRGTIFFKF